MPVYKITFDILSDMKRETNIVTYGTIYVRANNDADIDFWIDHVYKSSGYSHEIFNIIMKQVEEIEKKMLSAIGVSEYINILRFSPKLKVSGIDSIRTPDYDITSK